MGDGMHEHCRVGGDGRALFCVYTARTVMQPQCRAESMERRAMGNVPWESWHLLVLSEVQTSNVMSWPKHSSNISLACRQDNWDNDCYTSALFKENNYSVGISHCCPCALLACMRQAICCCMNLFYFFTVEWFSSFWYWFILMQQIVTN